MDGLGSGSPARIAERSPDLLRMCPRSYRSDARVHLKSVDGKFVNGSRNLTRCRPQWSVFSCRRQSSVLRMMGHSFMDHQRCANLPVLSADW